MPIDEAALAGEVANLFEPAETETEETPPENLYEFSHGDQQYKFPLNMELPIKHNGQVMNAPLEQVLNAWRERQHFSDRNSKFKQEREAFEKERGDVEQYNALKQKYSAIQDWSEQNPDQWERLWTMFQERDKQLTDQDNPMMQELSGLKKELGELRAFRDEFTKKQEEEQVNTYVKEIETEIEEFSKKFPQYNLAETDMDGKSLKARIITHGLESNLPTFRISALSYLESDLLKSAESRGRQEAVKAVQSDKKAGILERRSTPFGQGEFNPVAMDEEALNEAARAELAQQWGKQ